MRYAKADQGRPEMVDSLFSAACCGVGSAFLRAIYGQPEGSAAHFMEWAARCSTGGDRSLRGVGNPFAQSLKAMALSMAGGLLTVFLTYMLEKISGQSTTISLILAGMIMSSMMNALISLAKYTADPYSKLPAITYWLLGSFANSTYGTLRLVALPMIVSIIVIMLLRWKLNILSMGDEEAMTMGVNPVRVRLIIIMACTVLTACSVMATGIIGWVGLVIPHISRILMGADHKNLIPASAIIGGVFMVAVDIIARSVMAAEIPIGILTALIGAPFFAVLFRRIGGNTR